MADKDSLEIFDSLSKTRKSATNGAAHGAAAPAASTTEQQPAAGVAAAAPAPVAAQPAPASPAPAEPPVEPQPEAPQAAPQPPVPVPQPATPPPAAAQPVAPKRGPGRTPKAPEEKTDRRTVSVRLSEDERMLISRMMTQIKDLHWETAHQVLKDELSPLVRIGIKLLRSKPINEIYELFLADREVDQ